MGFIPHTMGSCVALSAQSSAHLLWQLSNLLKAAQLMSRVQLLRTLSTYFDLREMLTPEGCLPDSIFTHFFKDRTSFVSLNPQVDKSIHLIYTSHSVRSQIVLRFQDLSTISSLSVKALVLRNRTHTWTLFSRTTEIPSRS